MEPPPRPGNSVQVFIAGPGPQDGHRYYRRPRVQRQPCHAIVDVRCLAAPPGTFGQNPDATAGVEHVLAEQQRRTVAGTVHGKLAGCPQDPAEETFEHLFLDQDVHRTWRRTEHHRPVQETDVVAGKDHWSPGRDIVPAGHRRAVHRMVQDPANRPAPSHGPAGGELRAAVSHG